MWNDNPERTMTQSEYFECALLDISIAMVEAGFEVGVIASEASSLARDLAYERQRYQDEQSQ